MAPVTATRPPAAARNPRPPLKAGVPASPPDAGDAPAGAEALSDADIHERIFNALMDQRLPPGTRLAEDKLGQVFGVSRTRIRQVLIRLAGEQLVTLIPHRGASVAQPTPAEAREVFGVRRLVEPVLVSSFIDVATPALLRELKQLIDDEERQRVAGDRGGAIRTAGAFHLLIARHAGNATLERLMREMVSRTSLVLMSYGPADFGEPSGCRCQDHRALQAAIRLRDKAAACRLMLAHLDRAESQLVFESTVPAPAGLAELLSF